MKLYCLDLCSGSVLWRIDLGFSSGSTRLSEGRQIQSEQRKILQLRPSHRGKQTICYCSLKSTCRRLFSWRLQLSLYVFLDFELTALIQEEKFLSLVSGTSSVLDFWCLSALEGTQISSNTRFAVFDFTFKFVEVCVCFLIAGFDSDCDVDPDPSFREIMKDVEIFGSTIVR